MIARYHQLSGGLLDLIRNSLLLLWHIFLGHIHYLNFTNGCCLLALRLVTLWRLTIVIPVRLMLRCTHGWLNLNDLLIFIVVIIKVHIIIHNDVVFFREWV